MNSKREQVWVGTFVLVAAAVLIAVVLTVSGTFSKKGIAHKAYFRYAAGLAPGAPVRYGGLLAGRVDGLRVDPQDTTRIEIDLSVTPDIPVKTDSLAKISALGALGESYLEITTGTRDSPLAPPGSVLKSKEMVAIADLSDMISGLVPTADQALQNLNGRLSEMKQTIAQVNDLLGDRNRKNVADGLATLNGMLVENRPKVAATLDNVQTATNKLSPILANAQTASDKIAPLLDDLKGTIKQANDALARVDAVVAENRSDIRASVVDIRKTLSTASAVLDELQNTVDRNIDNVDSMLANVEAATENMQQLTDALKRNPSLLIRGETGKDRKPGDGK